MKKTILILGIAVLAAMAVSCNKDETKIKENKVFEGDKAYVLVNINSVSASQTRATDEGFMAGDEHAVQNAYFYFYDEDGVFVTEASTALTEDETSTATGIEYAANTVVTLTGLTQVSYPNWVVTVLNRPSGFTAPNTLDGFADALADPDSELLQTSGEDTYFLMTTSSYVDTDNSPYYFATPVKEENFVPEDVEYDTDGLISIPSGYEAVDIYVERVAAKVTVAVSSELTESSTLSGTYELVENVYEDNDSETATEETLYIKFNGWKLNATTRESNYVKAIDPTTWGTDDSVLGFTWNDATNHRSYWGKSWNYGLGVGDGSYPTDGSNGNKDTDEAAESTTALSPYVKYTSLSSVNTLGSYTPASGSASASVTYGTAEYCAENTNTAAMEGTVSALTSILVSATVCGSDGEGMDLVRADGHLYTLDKFLDLAAEHLSGYYSSDEGTAIDGDDFELVTGINGFVTVALKDDVTVYEYDSENEEYVEADSEAEDGYTKYISSFNNTYCADANYFNGGAMYYCIPIQHLNNTATSVDTDGNTVYNEANYGVVRNHWYLGYITGLTQLGKGIADTAEVIVPLPEETTYYIPATVSILDWEYVTFGFDL